jgi:hypothetical protein
VQPMQRLFANGLAQFPLQWLHPSRRPRCGLLRMRSETLMVRIRSQTLMVSAFSRVSNQEATAEAARILANQKPTRPRAAASPAPSAPG